MTYDPTQSLGARLHAASREALGHADPIGISNFPKLPPSDQTYWERAAVNFVARLSDAPEPYDWSDAEDDIADAISDSLDMDWSSRDGARAVVAYLKQIGAQLP